MLHRRLALRALDLMRVALEGCGRRRAGTLGSQSVRRIEHELEARRRMVIEAGEPLID